MIWKKKEYISSYGAITGFIDLKSAINRFNPQDVYKHISDMLNIMSMASAARVNFQSLGK